MDTWSGETDVGDGSNNMLQCAGLALAGALAESDGRNAAALLRCAAKYLEGWADAGGEKPRIRLFQPEARPTRR